LKIQMVVKIYLKDNPAVWTASYVGLAMYTLGDGVEYTARLFFLIDGPHAKEILGFREELIDCVIIIPHYWENKQRFHDDQVQAATFN